MMSPDGQVNAAPYVIADDHTFQKAKTVCPLPFRHGQGGWHYRATRMSEGRRMGIISFIGMGSPRYILGATVDPHKEELAKLLINTTSREAADEIRPKLERWLWERYPDLDAVIMPLDYGPPVTAPVGFCLNGDLCQHPDGFDRKFPYRRLSREHDTVGSVQDSIGDICGFCPGGPAVVHHGL